MGHEHVYRRSVYVNRYVPVTLGGESEFVDFFFEQVHAAVLRTDGHRVVRHILTEELPEGPDFVPCYFYGLSVDCENPGRYWCNL